MASLGRHPQQNPQQPCNSYSASVGRGIDNVKGVFERGWGAGGPAWGEGEEGGQPSRLDEVGPVGKEEGLGVWARSPQR